MELVPGFILLQFRQEIIICLEIDDCNHFQTLHVKSLFVYNYIADFLQLLRKRNLKEYSVRLSFIKFYFFRWAAKDIPSLFWYWAP